ncbi:hypothetical protein [Pseudomonas putida]|uniref:Uncharacterized protein n=1 Tax=Pseudomonas putida TaxID=303 RepID=A0A8I1EAW1_PSEPU|nr:hypothetical protein [Pseudomonas putida]MBI6883094.1 hypothetical protein [Pseudomonas putida]
MRVWNDVNAAIPPVPGIEIAMTRNPTMLVGFITPQSHYPVRPDVCLNPVEAAPGRVLRYGLIIGQRLEKRSDSKRITNQT